MTIVLILDNEFMVAIETFLDEPSLLILALMYATSTFFGIYAYMLMIQQVGGVGTALVSTLRKVGTVVLSFVSQGRVFSWGYGFGGLFIVGSILLQKLRPLQKKKKKKKGKDFSDENLQGLQEMRSAAGSDLGKTSVLNVDVDVVEKDLLRSPRSRANSSPRNSFDQTTFSKV
jgi:hypothetical protein